MAGKDLGSMMQAMKGTTPSRTATAAGPRKPPPPAPPNGTKAGDAKKASPQPVKDGGEQPERPAAVNGSGELANMEAPQDLAVREHTPRRRTGGMPPPPPKSGDLVQARVQPSEIGSWANEIMDQVEYAFGTTKGTALGAMLFLAFSHWDEYAEFLESWLGKPEDPTRQMVWNAVQQRQQERLAEPSVLEAER